VSTISGFSPVPSLVGEDLGARVGLALGKTVSEWHGITTNNVLSDLSFTGSTLVAGDKPAIQTFLNGYVYDPLFMLIAELKTLKGIVPTMRQWATDARNESAAWAGQSQAARDSAMATTFTRLGTLMDRLADVVTGAGWN
jgi:hypothetical protein